MMQDRSNLFS